MQACLDKEITEEEWEYFNLNVSQMKTSMISTTIREIVEIIQTSKNLN